MGYLAWMSAVLLAVVAIVLLLFFPGLWLVALVAAAVLLVMGILALVRRGDTMSDEEYDRRTRAR